MVAVVVASKTAHELLELRADARMSGDLAAFRASHISIADAIMQCDRPDWALQLAFDAASDKRAVVAMGANIACVLRSESLPLRLVLPWPGPLEAIDVWADNTDATSFSLRIARALTIAAYLAIPVTWFLVRFAIKTLPGSGRDTGAMALLFWVAAAVIALASKLAIDGMIRFQVARLDEQSAFAHVMGLVTKRMENNPAGIRRALRLLRFGLPGLVGGS